MNENEDFVKQLRLMYRDKLILKIDDLEKQWKILQEKKLNDEEWKTFYKMVHQFNGSSGSYGYPEISRVVLKLETYIIPHLGEDQLLTDEQEKIIREELGEIRKVVQEAYDSNSP